MVYETFLFLGHVKWIEFSSVFPKVEIDEDFFILKFYF